MVQGCGALELNLRLQGCEDSVIRVGARGEGGSALV